jgi:hypothetical protein
MYVYKYLDRTSVGALPVVAGAIRLAVFFCLAYRGRHPQSAEACLMKSLSKPLPLIYYTPVAYSPAFIPAILPVTNADVIL